MNDSIEQFDPQNTVEYKKNHREKAKLLPCRKPKNVRNHQMAASAYFAATTQSLNTFDFSHFS